MKQLVDLLVHHDVVFPIIQISLGEFVINNISLLQASTQFHQEVVNYCIGFGD